MFSEFRKECKKLVPAYASYLELPPSGIADLALPCFALAKEQKRAPQDIAKEIAAKIKIPRDSLVQKVEANGPYVNFFINYAVFMPVVLKAAVKPSYGYGKKKKEKVMIESPGPNTNKPLHLGHIRNMAIGMSLSNMLKFAGYKTINVDIINDRGIHICKSMLAYQKFGKGKSPDKKPDHFVGDFYVLFARELEGKPGVEEELRQALVDWENNDTKTRALWKKMNSWAVKGMKETYDRFGMHIDKAYYESEHYLDGKKIALAGVKTGVFKKDADGNVIADLENHGLGKRVILRPDGTAVYLTQDIALAIKRYKDFRMNNMIYVVGAEQIDHFRALFKIFDILGHPFAKNCYHLAYGMVNLPEGKMKSREGTVVDADDLMNEMHKLAADEIKQRDPKISKKELEKRAEKIGLAAIKYYILKFDALKVITYDPKVSIEFEGDTGPYLLYTYARCKSIMRKAKIKPKAGSLGKEEEGLIKKISMFSEVVNQAARDYKPHVVANYAFELAAIFNEYYHAVKVVGSDKESGRLALVGAIANVLKTCLDLMGIEALEKM
ncbi:MAG: arginine--tRNA ligase [Candidatus Aenigmarchaeota archaeon]|nr:arginine--tRNA ligase [Candidatus Aenigmarchaeota archaeon]